MKPIVIFGAGKVSDVISACIERDGAFTIAAYTCDPDYVKDGLFRNRPLIAFDKLGANFAPDRVDMLIAVGYQECNEFRARCVTSAHEKGYRLVNYVSRRALVHPGVSPGENTVILDGAVVQQGTRVGHDSFVWDGALIGHHSVVEDHCWITGSAAVGGCVHLSRGCFLGLHATVGHGVRLGKRCLIGAGTLLTKDIPDETVIVRRDSETHRLTTTQFSRLTHSWV